MAKNNKKFDFVVIGDSLPAILTAVENSTRGLKGAIFSGSETLGGLHRGVNLDAELETSEHPPRWVDTHVNYIVESEQTIEFLARIKKYVPELDWTEVEIGPLTFQNGTVQPFLGFGAHSVDGIDFYSYFTATNQLQLNISLTQIVQKLLSQFDGEILTNHEVTQLQVTDNIAGIQTNGTEIYGTERIYYFESAAKLGKIIPTDNAHFPKATVQKVSKSQTWAVVNLTYWHKAELTDSKAMHVLYGAKDIPCVGAFSKTTDGETVSQWLSILSSENFADAEQLGLAIREMKKQIKRMYPNFYDSIHKEFIVVAPEAYGHALHAVANHPDLFKNHILYLGSQHYANEMAFTGEAASYLALEPLFAGTAIKSAEESAT